MITFYKKESGEVIVLVAIFMTIFVGFLALVVDVGSIYLEKNRLQKIVDTAVLAGAQELPSNYEKAKMEGIKTIISNNGNPDDFTFQTNSSYTMLEVSGASKAIFYFANALGISEPTITAHARVELQPIISGIGVIPVGVPASTDLTFGTSIILKGKDTPAGDVDVIVLSGHGANDFEEDLRNGYEKEIKVGDILETRRGQIVGPTRRGVQGRIDDCPDATYLNYPPDCDRVVLVPVFEPLLAGNRVTNVKVVGFATFFLESVSLPREGAEITGRFIKALDSGETKENQTNYGTYNMKLTH